MGLLRRILPPVLWLAACLPHGRGAVYYVSKGGSDLNAGSVALPWLTIQKAASTVVSGDVVRVQSGTYAERVTETTSGSSSAPITYIADGSVILRGFNISGNYVRIIGFEITHNSSVGHPGVAVSDAHHVTILDCNIHNTDGISIDPVGANYLTIRGNLLNYSGSPGNNGGPGAKSIDDWGTTSNNMLIEYNTISHTTDYICSNGDYYIARNNVFGPTLITDFGGTPHVDGWQANCQTRYAFMEANWHVNNAISDSHMVLIETPTNGANGHFAVTKNVSLRSGDQLWFQMRSGDNLHAAHNSVGQVGFGPRGGPGGGGFFYIWSEGGNPSNYNFARNNIYYNVTTQELYSIMPGSDCTHDHDHADVASDIANGVNGNIKSNPVSVSFTNYAGDNLLLKATAPDIDSGGALTTVTSASGTGTSFAVANPDWFYDGFSLTEGQKIYVGSNNNLTIISINYATRTITVNAQISWSTGAAVGYAYRGAGPDLGAYEYGDTLLTSATLSGAGSTYTVIPDGDTRFVVFYQDGIPHTTIYTAPYTATIGGGIVTAKAYALHAQNNPVVVATASVATAPLLAAQPSNATVAAGAGGTFTIAATGTAPLSYQWQRSANAGSTWADLANDSTYSGIGTATLTVSGATTGMNGHQFRCVVANSAGTAASNSATLTVTAAPIAPSITSQPASTTVTAGSTAHFTVGASGTAPLTFQWRKGATAIPGATNATFSIANAQSTDAGIYSVVVTNSAGTAPSNSATLTVTAAPPPPVSPPSKLINLSSRTQVGTGNNITISGFVVSGSQPKTLLVRGAGPALTAFAVAGVVQTPSMTVFSGQTPLLNNESWKATDAGRIRSEAQRLGAFALPEDGRDCALIADFAPGAYTVHLHDRNGGTGVGLIELYDASADADSRLVNLSIRALVGRNDAILITGLVITGTAPKTLLVRAVGPGLAAFGLDGTLARPKMSVFSGQQEIATNTGWTTSANRDAIASASVQVSAFPLASNSHDSALLLTLVPGAYTIHVSGADGGTGTALVESYAVN